MSFTFEWPRFSEQFHKDAIEMLNSALNKGSKPPVIADKIEVVELEMGTQPPELEIRDIGDLTMDQFRGIFRLTYSGDAHLVLRTKVQANPLNHKQDDIHLMSGTRGMLAAKQPLVVPMLLRLSHFRLNSYVVLVVSKQKGITLVFKTDPLQNVDINSTFDSIAVIQKFIQREIEGQLRQMFREDLPGIIHRLSQQWVKAKVEAPYLDREREKQKEAERRRETMWNPLKRDHRSDPMSMSTPDLRFIPTRAASYGAQPTIAYSAPYNRAHSSSALSVASMGRRSAVSSPIQHPPPPPSPTHDVPDSSFPDIENFDPTYGLRPEGLPTKSVFSSFGRLFSNANKGLADLTEEPSDEDYEEAEGATEFDMVEWEDTVPEFSVAEDDYRDGHRPPHEDVEYETIPAVGGGVITRPRILHSQSQGPRSAGMLSRQSSLGSVPPAQSPASLTPSMAIPPSPSRLTQAALKGIPEIAGADRLARLTASSASSLSPRVSLSQLTPTAPAKPLARRAGSANINPYFPTMLTPSSSPSVSRPISPPTPPLYRSPHPRPISPDSLHTQPSRSSQSHSLSTPPSTEFVQNIHPSAYQRSRNDVRTPQQYMSPLLHPPSLAPRSISQSGPRSPSISSHRIPLSQSERQPHRPISPQPPHPPPHFRAQLPPQTPPRTPTHKRTFSHSSSTPSTSHNYDPSPDPFLSFPSDLLSTSPSHHHSHLHDPTSPSGGKIVLRPQLNNSISQLSTLSHSNHTLSPYTRSLEHFKVRSGPPTTGVISALGLGLGAASGSGGIGAMGAGSTGAGLGLNSPGGANQVPVRARRKRLHRLGGSKKGKEKALPITPNSVYDDDELEDDMDGEYARYTSDFADGRGGRPGPGSPLPPSEFDAGDMDKYFFTAREGERDGDVEDGPLEMHRSHVRRRKGAR